MKLLSLSILLAAAFLAAHPADAADRVALIIGNGEYREPKQKIEDSAYLPRIDSPAADRALMEQTLKSAGFDCTTLADQTTAQMRAAVRAFAAKNKGAPVVLFYYSGHGIAQDGVNYLAGVDAQIDVSAGLRELERAHAVGALSPEGLASAVADLKRRTAAEQLVPLEEILRELNDMSILDTARKIVLLDACRDPFAASNRERLLLASKGSTIIGKGGGGLARPAERPGMFIGFAAAAGQSAIAFPNDLKAQPKPSLFTRAFCVEALKPGISLRDAFDAAGVTVYRESRTLMEEQRSTAPAGESDAQEAQTPAAYTIVFPPGFAFVSGSGAPASGLTDLQRERSPLPALAGTPKPGKDETLRPVIPRVTQAGSGGAGTPKYATKETPFVNTLGMKFVPVKITGGLTNGQRVLFSVWDTRVQDYAEFAKATNREWKKPDFEQGPTHPVVVVSWVGAKAFCEWLTQKERASGKIGVGEAYRLPSDHEWSCAVGIGDREDASATPESKGRKMEGYPWGTQWPPPKGAGNFADETAKRAHSVIGYLHGYDDGYAYTSPVGSFESNRNGLYDMSGNVLQWCEDWYDAKKDDRAIRGGSWYSDSGEIFLRSSCRSRGDPTYGDDLYGFRCVLVVSGG